MDDLFTDAARQWLADHSTPAVVRAIEAGQSPAALWQQLEDSGFADALVPESAGGAGLGLAEAFPVMELCGAYALPVPLAETLVARCLLAAAGVARPAGSVVLAQAQVDAQGAWCCPQTGSGAVADWVLAVGPKDSRLLPVASARREAAVFCLDATLTWPADAVADAARLADRPAVREWQAFVQAALISGALQQVMDSTLRYANDRVQFGKPISKFQAVQHQLSVLAEHVYAARMAARLAACGARPDRLRVAVAKARSSQAAAQVAALAHSIHGAIGFTSEFDLQLYTRRLHAWRQAAGSESYWHDVLGRELVEHRTDGSLDLVRALTDLH